MAIRKCSAEKQLPKSCGRQVIHVGRLPQTDEYDVGRKRNCHYPCSYGQQIPSSSPGPHAERRPQQIKLLFDSERPKVQEWFRFGNLVEVSRLSPEDEVRNKS